MANKKVKKPKSPERNLFIKISALGMVDEYDKLVYSRSYNRLISQKDKPLTFLAKLSDALILPIISYSSPESAAADLKQFKEWAASIEHITSAAEAFGAVTKKG